MSLELVRSQEGQHLLAYRGFTFMLEKNSWLKNIRDVLISEHIVVFEDASHLEIA
jgi:hypothetical protein